jgi:hypothetical protein
VQIASLCSVAENFRPAGFFELRFSFDGGKDFLELADDFGIVVGLVEEAGDGVLGLGQFVSIHQISRWDETYLFDLAFLGEPTGRFAEERT